MSSPTQQNTISSPSPFETLSPELLESIFEYVYETSPSSISSLLRVSKVCTEVASRFRCRRLVFELKVNNQDTLEEMQRNPKLIRSLASDNPKNAQILKNVRSIELGSDMKWQTFPEGDKILSVLEVGTTWQAMATFIAKVTNLKEMTFSGNHPMPVILIEALAKHHPKARLHVKGWTRVAPDTDHNDPDEFALAHSTNLRSIDALFWNGPGTDLRPQALRRIIALSPNLESATLDQGRSGGCVTYGFTLEQLQEAHRRGRLFDVKSPSPNSIKHLKCKGTDQVFALQNVTDISKLESLEIEHFSDPDYFSKDGVPNSRFPSLRHLTINGISSWSDAKREVLHDALESFLISCQPLTTLALTGFDLLDYEKVLIPHGSSLQVLKIHFTESCDDKNPRQILSNDSLQKIIKICPFLRDVTLDINRSEDGSTEQEIIATIAAFPKLQTVQFYIDLGIAGPGRSRPLPARMLNRQLFGTNSFQQADSILSVQDDVPDPPLRSFAANPFHQSDDHFIPNIWSLLSSQKTSHGTVPLKALHVKVGEWERQSGGGYPADWVMWESSNRKYYMATPTDRDDRPDEIVVVEKFARWASDKRAMMKVPRVIRSSKLVKELSHHERLAEKIRKEMEEGTRLGSGLLGGSSLFR